MSNFLPQNNGTNTHKDDTKLYLSETFQNINSNSDNRQNQPTKRKRIRYDQILVELKDLAFIDKRRPLSGPNRRLYEKYRNEGKSVKEAYKLAVAVKRNQQKEPSNSHHKEIFRSENKIEKSLEVKLSKSNVNNTLEEIQVKIIHYDHPYTTLSYKQLEETQKLILGAVPFATKEGTKPQFDGLHFQPGLMFINCLDTYTFKWLEEITAEIKLENNTKIKAVRAEENIQNQEIVVGYFPEENEITERMIAIIEAQNDNLNVQNWKILNRKKEGTFIVLTFSIDSETLKILSQREYKIFYKFSQVTLCKKILYLDGNEWWY